MQFTKLDFLKEINVRKRNMD